MVNAGRNLWCPDGDFNYSISFRTGFAGSDARGVNDNLKDNLFWEKLGEFIALLVPMALWVVYCVLMFLVISGMD